MIHYVMNFVYGENEHRQIVSNEPFAYILTTDPEKGVVFKAGYVDPIENIETLDAGYFDGGRYYHLKQIVKNKEIVPFIVEGSPN